MADPRNTNLAFANFWELRMPGRLIARPLNKKGRNQDAGKKIALMPVGWWTQPYSRGTLGNCTVRRFANNVSPALFWETNGHSLKGYETVEKLTELKKLQSSIKRRKRRLFNVSSFLTL